MTETKEAANRARQQAKTVVDNLHPLRELPNVVFSLFARTHFDTNCCGINSRPEESMLKTGARIFFIAQEGIFSTLTAFESINRSENRGQKRSKTYTKLTRITTFERSSPLPAHPSVS